MQHGVEDITGQAQCGEGADVDLVPGTPGQSVPKIQRAARTARSKAS